MIVRKTLRPCPSLASSVPRRVGVVIRSMARVDTMQEPTSQRRPGPRFEQWRKDVWWKAERTAATGTLLLLRQKMAGRCCTLTIIKILSEWGTGWLAATP